MTNVTEISPRSRDSRLSTNRWIPLKLAAPIALLVVAFALFNWYGRHTPAASATGAALNVSAGGYHTCALTTAGGVKCWGDNTHGQLGDGTTIDSSTPVDVLGLSNGAVAVSAGETQTCALTTTGGIKCWGDNFSGQLGNGTTTDSSTPAGVSGLTSGVAAVSAGGNHTCALTTTDGTKCWGYNGYGQLGDGTTTNRSTPVDVVGLTSGVTAISAGFGHTCGLTTGGGVKCWGYNGYGMLGDGTTTRRNTPTDVPDLTSGVAAISAGGSHTCALTTGSSLKCWGLNLFGQLGDGQNCGAVCTSPVDVTSLASGGAAVRSGSAANVGHTCALTTASGLKCWGYNFSGQLGNGQACPTICSTAFDVAGLTGGVAAISAGGSHTCAITTSGTLECWGSNLYGQLGDGTTTSSSLPVDVPNIYLKSTPPTPTDTVTPTMMPTPNDGKFYAGAITAGFLHNCAYLDEPDTSHSKVRCWGNNSYSETGIGTSGNRSTSPADVCSSAGGHVPSSPKTWRCDIPFRNVTGISSGSSALHTCALVPATPNYAVQCWGHDDDGQLGDGTSGANRTVPVYVCATGSGGSCQPLTGVASVAGAYSHTCAVMQDGTARCWGENNRGQLGDGSTDSDLHTHPEMVCITGSVAQGDCVPLTNVTAITAGYEFTCAITQATSVKCWGENDFGQLGIGTSDYQPHPNPLDVCETGSGASCTLLTGVNSVGAGGYLVFGGYACAQTGSNVKCWGRNRQGQLGIGVGDGAAHPNPVSVCASGSYSQSNCVPLGSVTSLAVGVFHNCTLMTTTRVKCWGQNADGELGDRTTTTRVNPVDVCNTGAGAPCGANLLSNVVSVATGYFHTCALVVQSPSYNVRCWGDELYGQVGDGQATDKVLPTSALLDSDRDGCTDNAELGTNQDLGGKRDPNNFWDFFDTPDSLGNRDRMVTQADKDRVNARVGTNGSTSIDPLSFPASGYRTAYDRTDDPGSSEAWDLLGPNGTISNSGTTNDVSLVNAQLNDTCT